MLHRHVEHVGIQEVENHNPHLPVASPAVPSHRAKPLIAAQFLSGGALGHIQKLLRHEVLQFAKGLLLENRSHLLPLFRWALAQNQLPDFLKQGGRWVVKISLQRLSALEIGQHRELAARHLEKLADSPVQVGPIGRRGRFFSSQQLGDVGLCDLGGRRQVLLLQPQLFQPFLDDQANVHGMPSDKLTNAD